MDDARLSKLWVLKEIKFVHQEGKCSQDVGINRSTLHTTKINYHLQLDTGRWYHSSKNDRDDPRIPEMRWIRWKIDDNQKVVHWCPNRSPPVRITPKQETTRFTYKSDKSVRASGNTWHIINYMLFTVGRIKFVRVVIMVFGERSNTIGGEEFFFAEHSGEETLEVKWQNKLIEIPQFCFSEGLTEGKVGVSSRTFHHLRIHSLRPSIARRCERQDLGGGWWTTRFAFWTYDMIT